MEKVKVTSAEIIVTGKKEKPYFEIKYKEVGSHHYNIGYSSYDLNIVFDYRNEYFEIVEEPDVLHRIGYLLSNLFRGK